MEFRYATREEDPYRSGAFDQFRYENLYPISKAKPPWTVVPAAEQSMRPFEESKNLTDRLFRERPTGPSETILPPIERARIQGAQVSLLLEQFSSRHAINYRIRKDLDNDECRVGAKLDQIRDSPSGADGRFESELIKELSQIQKARHAEHVSCWRDSNRLMGDIFERWNEYQDNERRGRMMDFGL